MLFTPQQNALQKFTRSSPKVHRDSHGSFHRDVHGKIHLKIHQSPLQNPHGEIRQPRCCQPRFGSPEVSHPPRFDSACRFFAGVCEEAELPFKAWRRRRLPSQRASPSSSAMPCGPRAAPCSRAARALHVTMIPSAPRSLQPSVVRPSFRPKFIVLEGCSLSCQQLHRRPALPRSLICPHLGTWESRVP